MACWTAASLAPDCSVGTVTDSGGFGPLEYDTVMVVPGWTRPAGSMLITVPGAESSKTSAPVTPSPRPISSLRTSL